MSTKFGGGREADTGRSERVKGGCHDAQGTAGNSPSLLHFASEVFRVSCQDFFPANQSYRFRFCGVAMVLRDMINKFSLKRDL